ALLRALIRKDRSSPRWLILILALGEIVLGSLLVLGIARGAALWAALLLLVCFTVVLASLQRRGYRRACGCFGESKDADSSMIGAMLRNCLLMVVTMYLVLLSRDDSAQELWRLPASTVATAVLAAAALAAAVALIRGARELRSVQSSSESAAIPRPRPERSS
ncbi:MAG: hypothetical protein MJB57_11675, partial [Gemmatimonadetes bacterium]|nr:hypothetical protein [Gemmatimonadota bacterium]